MAIQLGYALSSEEHAPATLVRNARLAEDAGFDFLMISDHYHPWIDAQGHSPFVWSVLGAIAQATERIPIGTGVTCPTVRIHPAIIAQASATVAALMPGRFRLGVGTGEALNEHILGDDWPEWEIRAEMLEEAVEVIRDLWTGDNVSHYGPAFTVVNARVYDPPPQPVPVIVAAGGPRAAEVAGRIGDALCATSPDREVLDAFRIAGGESKPAYGQVTVCWAEDEGEARRTLKAMWPNAGIHGEASQELPLPRHFQQLAEGMTEDQLAEQVVCGPDLDRHVEALQQFVDAGFDHVYVHQVGPEQADFIDAYRDGVLPRLRSGRVAVGAGT